MASPRMGVGDGRQACKLRRLADTGDDKRKKKKKKRRRRKKEKKSNAPPGVLVEAQENEGWLRVGRGKTPRGITQPPLDRNNGAHKGVYSLSPFPPPARVSRCNTGHFVHRRTYIHAYMHARTRYLPFLPRETFTSPVTSRHDRAKFSPRRIVLVSQNWPATYVRTYVHVRGSGMGRL